jgi:SPX domain protein involved in polyphosphate accumulation
MKFGRNLLEIISSSDPEWTPYWINYKYLKKKIKDIVEGRDVVDAESVNNGDKLVSPVVTIIESPEEPRLKKEKRDINSSSTIESDEAQRPSEVQPSIVNLAPRPRSGSNVTSCTDTDDPNSSIAKSSSEVIFFRQLRRELKKASDFFASTEKIYLLRFKQISEGYTIMKDSWTVGSMTQYDSRSWTRLMIACMSFYKDCLLLENFALMNYCAFSKILKKHDKLTGYRTRDAFMRNVMAKQNFAHYPVVLDLLKKAEALFTDIQATKR